MGLPTSCPVLADPWATFPTREGAGDSSRTLTGSKHEVLNSRLETISPLLIPWSFQPFFFFFFP